MTLSSTSGSSDGPSGDCINALGFTLINLGGIPSAE